MHNARLGFTALMAAATLLGVGCGPSNKSTADTLRVEFDGLEPLGAGYVYEGWLLIDGNVLSAGRFNLAAGENSFETTMDADTLAQAAAYILTIEPEAGDDPAPSDTHLLAGNFSGDAALLTVEGGIGDNFSGAAGGYILQTPTTTGVAADYNQGIWFVDPSAGVTSLALPTLPAGWAYEGWVVDSSGPISTGRFTDLSAGDDDAGGPTSGNDPAPPFPGQDYINPPIDLVGLVAVITVEPEPDDSASPFALKPLIDTNIEDVGPGVVQPFANQSATLPTGTASIR